MDDSDDENDCDEYYVEDVEKICGQKILDWARAANLLIELQKQQSVDPDKIFINFENKGDLSALQIKRRRGHSKSAVIAVGGQLMDLHV